MSVRDLLKALDGDGWRLRTTASGPRQFVHPGKQGKITLNGHPFDEVPPDTLTFIRDHAGLK
jgi:predicted RNA binding protein YcfA (HicA-like mRNA interferase family)